MNEILEILVRHWRHLWVKGEHRIVRSYVDPSFPGAVIVLESSDLSLRFTCDRSDVDVEVRPRWLSGDDPWVDLFWLEALVSGRADIVYRQDVVAEFHERRRSEIHAHLCDGDAYENSLARCGELAKAAADRRWGPVGRGSERGVLEA